MRHRAVSLRQHSSRVLSRGRRLFAVSYAIARRAFERLTSHYIILGDNNLKPTKHRHQQPQLPVTLYGMCSKASDVLLRISADQVHTSAVLSLLRSLGGSVIVG